MESKKSSWLFIILGIILVLIAAYIVYFEIHAARTFCKSVNGTPSFTGKTCDGKPLVKYSDGWDFKRFEPGDQINISLD